MTQIEKEFDEFRATLGTQKQLGYSDVDLFKAFMAGYDRCNIRHDIAFKELLAINNALGVLDEKEETKKG